MGWLSLVLLADHDGGLGLQRLARRCRPGACCCWRCAGSPRPCARRRRSWWSSRRSWSTSSAPASRSTSTASTTSRPTCRPATAWSTSPPTRSGTPRGCAATSTAAAWVVVVGLGHLVGARAARRPARRARRLLVPLPRRLPAVGTVARGVRRGGRRRDLAGGARHRAGHVDVAADGPDRAGQHRQPARPVRPAATAGSTWPGCCWRRLVLAAWRVTARGDRVAEPVTSGAGPDPVPSAPRDGGR